MTNEEAIEELKGLQEFINITRLNGEIRVEAFDLAIKALETGEIYITGEDYNLYMEGYKAGKKDFEPKQGDWNEIQAGMFACPFCGAMPHKLYKNYCAKCGAKMKEVRNDI